MADGKEVWWDYVYEDSKGKPLCRKRFSKKGVWRFQEWKQDPDRHEPKEPEGWGSRVED